MAEGEFALMQRHLESALNTSSAMGSSPASSHDVYALLLDAAAQQRDQDALKKFAQAAEDTAMLVDHKLNTAIAHRAWGVEHTLAGELSKAEARLQQALDIFASYPAPWQMGRTLFDMGELARARGQAEQARDYYSRALSEFEGLRAAPYVDRTRAALETLGG